MKVLNDIHNVINPHTCRSQILISVLLPLGDLIFPYTNFVIYISLDNNILFRHQKFLEPFVTCHQMSLSPKVFGTICHVSPNVVVTILPSPKVPSPIDCHQMSGIPFNSGKRNFLQRSRQGRKGKQTHLFLTLPYFERLKGKFCPPCVALR